MEGDDDFSLISIVEFTSDFDTAEVLADIALDTDQLEELGKRIALVIAYQRKAQAIAKAISRATRKPV